MHGVGFSRSGIAWRLRPVLAAALGVLALGVSHARPDEAAAAAAAAASVPAPPPMSTLGGPQPLTAGRAAGLTTIITPARVRPGQPVNVRVTDTSALGGVRRARVCATRATGAARCRDVRLRAGQATVRARVRLPRTGRWTVTVRGSRGTTERRRVAVDAQARLRVLVTGDSMIQGIFEVLTRLLAPVGGTVRGDPHGGSGITKPGLDWPAHARRTARAVRPDVTFVMLGAANDSRPLRTAAGATVTCCDAAWIAEYRERLRSMMASYLSGGRSLVYYALLPAPRLPPDNPRKVQEFQAVNAAIRAAAASFPDGVRVIAEIADVIAPGGEYRDAITYRGRMTVVRERDGVHLARSGLQIAAAIVRRRLSADAMTPSR